MENLKGKTAYITGGTKGIGLSIAEAMMAEGMNVLITGRKKAAVDNATKSLNTKGLRGKAVGVEADVRNLEVQEKAVAQLIKDFGQLDVVIANAGVGHFASIDEMTSKQWNETIDVNLTGVFNSVKAGLDGLKSSEGYFISIASLAGTNFFAKGAAYNASKFGLVGFTQAVMLDLRQYGIKCTTIMPGSVATYFNNHTPTAADSWKIQPEDLGQMVIDLLKMNPRTLPSKVEVRPSLPGGKK
jgi:NAD(P)-dependent dehydrogenase (short-subunit alcohol dehydrogenase family)